MFDIGFWELVFLFGLGLMVLGPERMPQVAAKLGRWAGQARSIAGSARLARTGWLDSARIAKMVEAHIGGRSDHARLLWQLLMLDRSLAKLGID